MHVLTHTMKRKEQMKAVLTNNRNEGVSIVCEGTKYITKLSAGVHQSAELNAD